MDLVEHRCACGVVVRSSRQRATTAAVAAAAAAATTVERRRRRRCTKFNKSDTFLQGLRGGQTRTRGRTWRTDGGLRAAHRGDVRTKRRKADRQSGKSY